MNDSGDRDVWIKDARITQIFKLDTSRLERAYCANLYNDVRHYFIVIFFYVLALFQSSKCAVYIEDCLICYRVKLNKTT